MIISRKCSFDSAHFLPGYVGKCASVHGHHWVAEVGVDGPINAQGFVMDFSVLKSWLNDFVVEVFDHHLINDIIPNPTAENIASWIAEEFCEAEFEVRLVFIKIWETENSCVEWSPK